MGMLSTLAAAPHGSETFLVGDVCSVRVPRSAFVTTPAPQACFGYSGYSLLMVTMRTIKMITTLTVKLNGHGRDHAEDDDADDDYGCHLDDDGDVDANTEDGGFTVSPVHPGALHHLRPSARKYG